VLTGTKLEVRMSRESLITRAAEGDRQAFADLAAGEVDRMHALARLILRDPDLAEDAVQEALVRCWRRLPSLRDVDRFDAWLRRILVRAVADEFQRRRRFEGSIRVIRVEPATSDGAETIADRDELEHGFRRLSVDHRAVVVLHHFAGLPLTDVADTLGIPLGTAKSRYHYAMAALRAALDADARPGIAEEVRA
jgi:RNA polymerase sigma factor (sigma-70 family)